MSRRSPNPPRDRTRSAPLREWVGGRGLLPFVVTEEQYRPEMALWLELPDELIVGSVLGGSEEDLSLGRTLLDALRQPAVGAPRRPDRIRVADEAQAAEVRAAVPDIEVCVAPTPELDEIVRLMAQEIDQGDADSLPVSYLGDGRIDALAVDKLFRTAGALYGVAPWETMDDCQVLRMDIPALNVRGACVSVIGELGETCGFVVFPSLDGFERFLEAGERAGQSEGSLDLGTTLLSLQFVPRSELSQELLDEVDHHDWRVASAEAYPWVEHRDRDGVPRPQSEHDVRVAAACAASLSAFALEHRGPFPDHGGDPIRESYGGANGVEVRLAYPYTASHLSAVSDPPAPARGRNKVGRNESCPCGSGKKYKKCCLRSDEQAGPGGTERSKAHDLDNRIVEALHRFAARRFGDAWWHRAAEDFADHENAMELYVPWSVYCCSIEGKVVADWYLEERHSLPADERAWLQAQRDVWLSAWEVVAVEPGHDIVFQDLLSGEKRQVLDASASRTLSVRSVVLGRVIDFQGESLLSGCHLQPLPPIAAAQVVQRLRKRLRRKRLVPVDRLRDEKFGRYAIARWDEAADALVHRHEIPPRLQNTDGDEILLTVDHFDIVRGATSDVERLLAAFPDVDPPQPGDDERVFVFVRAPSSKQGDMENTLIGNAVVDGGSVRVETNSIARADALRARIEDACGDRLRHRIREHSDPIAALSGASGPVVTGAPEIPSEQEGEILRQFKARHYANWVDHPLPSLDGKTPREVAGTKAGKQQVDLLLKDFEYHEARLPAAQRFDFSGLRRQLGI